MPVFFFDIAEDGETIPDQQGLEFTDLEDARSHALSMAVAFLRQSPLHQQEHACSIDVTDQSRKVVFTVQVRLGETDLS